jgi:hypothetical protein
MVEVADVQIDDAVELTEVLTLVVGLEVVGVEVPLPDEVDVDGVVLVLLVVLSARYAPAPAITTITTTMIATIAVLMASRSRSEVNSYFFNEVSQFRSHEICCIFLYD